MYLKLARGVDPKPYKIWKVLGNGQYRLSRDGQSDGKVYLEQDLLILVRAGDKAQGMTDTH